MSDPLRLAALDAGDRLAASLATGDLDAAEAALADRQRALDALASADLPPVSSALKGRFRVQSEDLRSLFHDGLAEAREALQVTSRTATAHGRYHAAGSARSVLDTAPRQR